MLIHFRLQVVTISLKSSQAPQTPSKDTKVRACVRLAVPALRVPNAIRYDLHLHLLLTFIQGRGAHC
jgi:hypothetical protein